MGNKSLAQMVRLVNGRLLALFGGLVERSSNKGLIFIVGEVRPDEESGEVEAGTKGRFNRRTTK